MHFSQIQQEWRKYRFRLRLVLLLKTIAVTGICFSIFIFFNPEKIYWQNVFWGILGIFSISAIWSYIHVDHEYGFRKLAQYSPELSESLRIALELQEETSLSKEKIYFREKHLNSLFHDFQNNPPSQKILLKRPSIICICTLFLITTTSWHSISPSSELLSENSKNPVIEGISFRVLYPAYIGKEPDNYRKLPNTLNIPRGSRLEIYIRNEDIIDQARDNLFFQINKKNLLRWYSYKDRWMTALNPQKSGKLIFGWIKPNPVQYSLKINPDLPPELKVTWPDDPYIFSNSKLSIYLIAKDDYGLRQITLFYQVEGQTLEKEIIQSFEGHFKDYQETYPWELGSTPLKKGNKVKAWIEVSDIDTLNGPNITVSEPFEFTVQSIKQFHKSLMERLFEIDQNLGKLLDYLDRKDIPKTNQQELKIMKDLSSLMQDSYYDTMLSQELKNYIFELQNQLNYFRKNRKRAKT